MDSAAGDTPLAEAGAQIRDARAGDRRPLIRSFFDTPTNTASHVVHDPVTRRAAIIDSVLDFDVAAGRTGTLSADAIIAYVRAENLAVDWLLETHAHADHLSAAPYLQQALGGTLAIGREITRVQEVFGRIFDAGPDFASDGRDFDRLFDDGDWFALGDIPAIALHVPGHTPADMAYVIGDAVFSGDTLFMPDYGSARADFPGGDARQLYRSIRRLLSLPDETRQFVCHDYKAPGRERYLWETSIGAQRPVKVLGHDGVCDLAFVARRRAGYATLPMPGLLMPAVQVNMRGGRLPAPATNGIRYLKLPLDAI